MSISVARGPKGGPEAIESHLEHLWMRGPRMGAPIGGAAPSQPKTRNPLPLYVVSLEDIRDEYFLKRATQVGWRYLIFDNGPAAVADVRVTADLTPKLSQLTRGPIAQRLDGAMHYAQEAYGEARAVYEPRMLDIPELNTAALWMHGPKESLIPLVEGTETFPIKWEDPEFMSRLLRKAKSRMERGEDEGSAYAL
jgi:hypothetical protein